MKEWNKLILAGILLVCLIGGGILYGSMTTASAGQSKTLSFATASIVASTPSDSEGKFDTEEPPKTPIPVITSAPTPGLEPKPIRTAQPIPTLADPVTEEEALDIAWNLDKNGLAEWESPWTPDLKRTNPDRIAISSQAISEIEGIGPGSEYVDTTVWVIMIQGPVFIRSIGWSGKYSGITYVIGRETGQIVSIISVPPEIK